MSTPRHVTSGSGWPPGWDDASSPLELQAVATDEENTTMSEIDVNRFAQRLLAQYGPKAMHIAAQRALEHKAKGQSEKSRNWRRIEAAIEQMRGPAES